VDRSGVRAASKQLLGNIYRAEVAAAVFQWGQEPMTVQALADHTRIRYPRVHEEVGRLAEAALLHVVTSSSAGTDYKAVPTIYWELCAELLKELEER
jgi:hypothetical protein